MEFTESLLLLMNLSKVNFGNWLVRVGLMSEVIFETVVGTGNHDFSRVPPRAEKSQVLRGVLRASVEHNILNVANS